MNFIYKTFTFNTIYSKGGADNIMKKSRGFTLIELVIVIAILGLLAGIAIPRFLDSTASARGSRLVGDLRTIDSAISIYHAKTGNYPTTLTNLTEDSTDGTAFRLLGDTPTPPSGKMLIEQNSGKEKEFNSADTSYAIADGRAIYTCAEASKKNVDYYLGLDSFLDDLLAEIIAWQKDYPSSTRNNAYIYAQKDFVKAGLVKELTAEEISQLLGGLPATEKLYLKSATVVQADGSLADIQFVTKYPNSPSNWYENYNACAFIVEGQTYVRTDDDGNLSSSIYLPTGTVVNGGNAKINTCAEAVQYVLRESNDINWFTKQLTLGGFKKI